jgi:hypothetical protein
MRFTSMLFTALLFVASATAADFVGTWKLNIAKSKLPATAKVASVTLTVEQTEPNTYKVIQDSVLQSGEKQHFEIVRIYDGKEHVSEGVGFAKGRSEICEIVDDKTRKIVVKRDGKETDGFTLNVSPDGKTMTNTNTRTGTKDPEIQVYERQ